MFKAVVGAYNDEATIRGTLACLSPFVEEIVVMLSEKPIHGEYSPPDKTEQICNEFDKVNIIKGVWKDEHLWRALGVRMCDRCDWVITFDSDEMMTAEDMHKFIEFLNQEKERSAVVALSKVYWGTLDYRLVPDPDHTPVVAVRNFVKYPIKRNVDCAYRLLPQTITHHHLSWCKPKDIHKKVTNYTHANEFDGETWYKRHFENWKPGDDVIMPTGTIVYQTAYDPLPQELRYYLGMEEAARV